MQLRSTFFIKLFLGFWLVTLAVLGSWMLSANYFDTRPYAPAMRGERPAQKPHRIILHAIYDLEHLESDALAARIQEIEDKHDLQVFLLNRQGDDILDRIVPAEVLRTADNLRRQKRRALPGAPDSRQIAHRIFRPQEGPMRAVFVFKNRRHFLSLLGRNPGLRLSLAIVVSGLVCFALSRMLSGRLRELQFASRRLANGDLDTRLDVRDQGGDETDELARDFNSMAEQLQVRIKAQKRLLADVSHELRSPLARLRISLALAQEDKENRSQHLQRMEKEMERLEELVGQLLVSQSHATPFDRHLDLVLLLQQLCDDAGFEGSGDNKTVEFIPGAGEAVVETAGDLLHKTFDNLLRNALAHSPPNSTISVALSLDEGKVTVCITDQGPGVPDAELENIFEAFYRLDPSRQTDSGNYGLGLSIARRAVLRHGGNIRAENRPQGLAVLVSLPVHSHPIEC